MTELGPLLFQPWLRPMPWGGAKLAKQYGLQGSGSIGEAWLLSDHSLHQSVVTHGRLTGRTLPSLIAEFPRELGLKSPERFPLLLKILDAQENLSVQVHPDDALARTWAPAEGGKTEAWTILDAERNATLYLGLASNPPPAEVERHLREHTLVDALNHFQANPGDTYYLPAGTVHAMGKGVLALEVQQTSDATFRLYDWGRVDAAGKPRALHLEAGLACIQHLREAGLRPPAREANTSWDLLVQSPFFRLRRSATSEVTLEQPSVIIPWSGAAHLSDNNLTIPAGHACLVPWSRVRTTMQLDAGTVLFQIDWTLAK